MMHPTDSIQDSDLRELYARITRDPYAVIRASTGKIKDRLAVAQAKRQAVSHILEDFDEHGEANRGQFGGHRRGYFVKLSRRLDAEIAVRRRRGEESDVFDRYRKAYDAQIDRSAQEFVDEMDAEEALGRAIANEMAQAGNEPSLVLSALEKLSKLSHVGPPASDAIQGVVHNTLRDCAIRQDFVSGGRIVLAYAKISQSIERGLHTDLLVGSAAIVARDLESRRALCERLAVDPPKDPRLAYNLACNAAVAGDKEQLLKHARNALNLGKQRGQFMADPDFAPYLGDREFLGLFERRRGDLGS